MCPDKEGFSGLQNPRLANSRRNLGNCRCSAKTFSALKREEEKYVQSGKNYLVAEGLRSSGLIFWLCSGLSHNLGQSQFISLCHCSSIITWISPYSTTLSLSLSASPAESINSARYRQLWFLISHFSLSGFDCLWFDLFLFVLCPATSSRAYGWYHNKNKIHSWVFESFCV